MQVPSPQFIREAEIKHGRVAMVAGGVLAELYQMGFENPSMVLAHSPMWNQVAFFVAIGIVECVTYLPRLSVAFSLREGVTPGVFGERNERFPPTETMVAREDVVGRFAMLGVIAFLCTDVLSA